MTKVTSLKSGEIFIEQVVLGEVYDEVPHQKTKTGCLPFAFTISDTNLKFGFVSGDNFTKVFPMIYQGGIMFGKGVYTTMCFFGSILVPV